MRRYKIVKEDGILVSVPIVVGDRRMAIIKDEDVEKIEVEGTNLYVTTKDGERYLTDDHAGVYEKMGWIEPTEEN